MTKLALYDKREGDADRLTNGYFRHDYLYRKNMATRLSVGLGGFILLLVYWLRVIIIDGVDVLTADLNAMAYDSAVFLLALMAAYSVVGTLQGTREYYLAQRRLDRYLILLRQIERIEARAHEDENENEDDDSNLVYRTPRARSRDRGRER